ncbi:dTDP-4-dehydrorhamnose reductase [Myroides odoratimimus]|uniref:dTDP-4-dehydrorhamnose reductase n=1 Tax=Myroides odoratimimus TaxID=76832 RepID=UPI00103F9757|nr:dTDP-4-dehydrorhamnose reductase [Myroides odoratimimus]QBK77620.1 dTDP-4-dehydrorhamnose reductase [Myroides odoratimimus]WHT73067.1 dTDP-4-dehydrorhamnose reductase [Myroides odoratimimus]WHU37650.1 dTDP-4-dehydrorhamnose reductase [Myroides odoratimimus]
MKILVTGSTGQLGSELKDLVLRYSQYDFVFMDRALMPLDNTERVLEILESEHPDFIINAGAYTAVDKAESEADLADMVNHQCVRVLGEWCEENESHLIHISTDYVFDGTSSSPLNEEALTAPINVYGATKRKGEEVLMSVHSDAIVIRTSWVYSSYGNNFVKTMCRLMQERESLGVVSDQIGTPTYAADLAKVIMQIISSNIWKGGLYHYSNEGEISWFDFASKIKELMGFTCEVDAIDSSAFPTPAKRPAYSLLDKSKIKREYNINIPHWDESLKIMLVKL